jgi:hypothetical protein
MANGIGALGSCSRGAGDVCPRPRSEPKNEFPAAPGGIVDVGDGSTSASLDVASLRSLFQIPVPHGNVVDPGARLRTADGVEWEPQAAAPDSAEGVLGCDVVGDMELLANDPFRGRGGGCVVSFSHEARRTGFCGCASGCGASWRCKSLSSSELANASESGVDRP